MTNWAVDLIGVHKTYSRKIQALRGVNVQVGRGEIFGLLGPNGAGKTTLVKIMMTVVRPDRASGTMLGRPLGNRKKLAVVGYLPESHRFPPYLTGRTLLDYYAALARVPADVRRKRSGELLERTGMAAWATTRISKYSKGMMQRLGLAQALMNDPELLILDEPTDGVDPMGRRDIRELLLELKRRGKTIFINSHLLSELEMVCDRVSILVNGLVARQGTLRELTEQSIEYRIRAEGDLPDLRDPVGKLGGQIIDGVIVLRGHDTAKVNACIDLLRARGVLIRSVEPKRFSLEDVFVEAVGGPPSQGSDRSSTQPIKPPVARPAKGGSA
jgi:ABC-2 type transport system ATP-binding protein